MPEQPSEQEPTHVSVPIIPCEAVVAPATEDYTTLAVRTILTTQMFHLDRAQCIKLGSELIRAGEKMRRPLEVPRLLVPE